MRSALIGHRSHVPFRRRQKLQQSLNNCCKSRRSLTYYILIPLSYATIIIMSIFLIHHSEPINGIQLFDEQAVALMEPKDHFRDGQFAFNEDDADNNDKSRSQSTGQRLMISTVEIDGTTSSRVIIRPEPLIANEVISFSSSSSSPSSSSMNTDTKEHEEKIDDGLCKLGNTTRYQKSNNGSINRSPTTVTTPSLFLIERLLSCSRIDEDNYRQLVKNMYKNTVRNKVTIQQIEITNSESSVVFSAIDLICERFNCSKLTVFNITGLQIQEISGLNKWLDRWTQLEVLDLSNTSLPSIQSIIQSQSKSSSSSSSSSSLSQPPSIVMQNLTTLVMDFNNISELNFDFILDHMPNLRHLSAVNNSIFNISSSESSLNKFNNQLETIGLANNSINCDDRTQMWLMEQIQDPIKGSKFPEHEQIRCSAPEKLIEMTWNQRLSVLRTPICDDCECKSIKRTAISVDCHNRNLKTLPDVLPLNTKILNLTSNRISSLEVPNESKNWENVTYVYLANNLITSFQPLEINSKFLRNLAAIDVRGNKFQEFPSHIFEQFINLDQVHLSNNPWLCECDATFAFQEWLQRQFQKVGDKEDILCGISGSEENGVRSINQQQRLSGRVVYRLSKSDLCPQEDLEGPWDWLDVINLLLSLAILLILSKVSLDYIYQRRTKRLPNFFKLNL